uniref:uncharacterized protein LOC122607350 n=1 Tax=Erigeron canadensis TaxID=72917 RepID=UPI001CB977BD|nr:uncharacterized protein LOC122607350 [Erigeron canadensis]
MDSLVATYASSSDEEDEQQDIQPKQQNPSTKSGPNPFTSLPPPKSQKPTSLFSKLPQPKSEISDPFSVNPKKPKKVVTFHPPIIKKPVLDDDEDDDDDDKQVKKDSFLPQEAPSVMAFISSMAAPRNSGSLGSLQTSAGTGRRSILEAGVSNSNAGNLGKDSLDNNNSANSSNVNLYANTVETNVEYASYDYGVGTGHSGYGPAAPGSDDNVSYSGYENVVTGHSGYGPAAPVSDDNAGYSGYENVGTGHSGYGPAAPANDGNVGYSGYEAYSDYGQYESKWVDRSGGYVEPEVSVAQAIQNVARVPGKRGRNEIPQEVIEVSQDDLMKNRPREDQTKATGIAFGPAYQSTSSTKGKISKMHKRKHQIGTLYFDMKSKEMELAERRSRGFLTKAETHAKYGW